MPLIIRITEDMFELADVSSFMVNPVNLQGVPGKGLALEFRNRVPQYVEQYRTACRDKSLRMGTVQVIRDTGEPWDIINLPTKDNWQNHSEVGDIKSGLAALRALLQEPQYLYSVVTLPMLGAGLGMLDYPTVYPLMMDYLADLDATVFLSMSPQRTEMQPKYLTIAGPLDWGHTPEHQDIIRTMIGRIMDKWEMKLSDYEGIVSGGYPGVDQYVCGDYYLKGQDSYIQQVTGKMPLVVKPNKTKDGVGANLHLGNLLCEIGDDVILFKPKGHNNNRLSAMQVKLQADREEKERSGILPKRVGIWGDTKTDMENPGLLIQEEPDIAMRSEQES